MKSDEAMSNSIKFPLAISNLSWPTKMDPNKSLKCGVYSFFNKIK